MMKSRPTETGVIFFLRQRNASTDIQRKTASPIHPFYAVYIRKNGDIRYGCANTRQVLDLFESAAVGKIEPRQKLCIQFDTETQNGENMVLYNGLLKAVINHISRAHTTTQTRNLRRGGPRDFALPLESEVPRDTSDFELVTWLVITTPQAVGGISKSRYGFSGKHGFLSGIRIYKIEDGKMRKREADI